jgi:nucleoside-diphosphate-sugar epimerase
LILITGANGFVGKHVVRHLSTLGHTIVSLVRNPIYSDKKTEVTDETTSHYIVIGDINNEPMIPFKIDTIIHLAGQIVLPGVTDEEFLTRNKSISGGLVRLMKRLNVGRIINLSSVSIYGSVRNGSALEGMSPHNPNTYGASKYATEVQLSAFSETVSITHVRTPGIIGPGANPNLITKLAECASTGAPIELAHLEASFNSVIHIMDVCKFLDHLLLTSPKAGTDSVNLSSNSPILIKQMGELILNFYGNNQLIKSRDSSTLPFLINVDKLEEVYNFRCLTVTETILDFLAEIQ